MRARLVRVLPGLLGMVLACSDCALEGACWTDTFGGEGFESFATGVAIDPDDNLYVVGRTEGGLEGNARAGADDGFLTLYDASGTRLWTRLVGSDEDDAIGQVSIGRDGRVHLVGYTFGDLDGNTHDGSGGDAFVTTFDASGTRLWTRQIGFGESESASGAVVDGQGNIYVVGNVSIDIAGTIENDRSVFLAKLDAGGHTLWTRDLESTPQPSARAVAVDGEDNVYVAGQTEIEGTLSDSAVWLAKVDPSGEVQWTSSGGAEREGFPTQLVIDPAGDLYVAGGTRGLSDLVVFLSKYDAAGEQQWRRELVDSSFAAVHVRIEGPGEVKVYTAHSRTLTQPSSCEAEYCPGEGSGDTDTLVAMYEADGTLAWERSMPAGRDEHDFSDDSPRAVNVDSRGDILVVGAHRDRRHDEHSAVQIARFCR